MGHRPLFVRVASALAFAVALSVAESASAAGAVIIHEIHYNPVEGANLEFVELHNPGTSAVDISGWSLRCAIDFEFPRAAVTIAAGGYLVVCRNQVGVSRRFGIPVGELFGDFSGNLSNGGERLELADSDGRTVDAVDWDDRAPWPANADGFGPSLERLCASFDSDHPANWSADAGAQPTPGVSNSRSQCPPQIPGSPRVAIHEIFYLPANDYAETLEFVELINTTNEAINLRGWFFIDGIEFIFADDTTLEPGGIVAVCRDQDAVRQAFDIENTVGNYTGQLSNDGERLTLIDADGEFVDSVRYGDHGDWPVVADGFGFSLEKVLASAPSDDPASWNESRVGDPERWNAPAASGRATSDALLIYNGAEGEFILDNISLRRTDQPEVELVPNGTFDAGVEGWTLRGNHATSEWIAGGGPDGSGALRLLSSGRGTGRTQGISLDFDPGLDRSPALVYVLRLDWRHVSGDIDLTMRLSGSSPSTGVYWRFGAGIIASPGAPNGNRRTSLPPFVDRVERTPREPRSDDPVSLTARVRGESVESVTVLVQIRDGESFTLPMFDDGLASDGAADDGIWGVEVPPAPHSSRVTFRIVARSAMGEERVFPPDSDPMPGYGYYVDDAPPESALPVYTLIYQPASAQNARALIAALDCNVYRPSEFAFAGDLWFNCGIRRRGQSVCGDADVIKKFLKLSFPHGHDFRGVRKINLQSLWTDKALVREHMAWQNFAELGSPYCYHEYLRLHVNGSYFGLYAELEHPGKRFLERNGLNPDGNLYKAVASREERTGQYEKKTNEDDPAGDADLRSFLDGLHRTTNSAALIDFFHTRADEDAIIDYQLAQMLPNNRDYPHKNHYLYHDTATGKWMPTTWDMDLTYGKRWDGTFEGVLNDLMDNPGVDPWYTTNVNGGGTGNHLLDRFFFNAGTWYRRAFLVRLWSALAEKYTNELTGERIDGLRALLLDEQAEDIAAWGRSRPSANDPRAPAEFDPNLERVRQHIRSRREFLLGFLRNTHRFTGHPRLKVTELMYDPVDDAEQGEFIELWNNSGEAIDVSGWTIAGIGARREDGSRDDFVFPAATGLATDEVIVVAKDPLGFRIAHGDSVQVFGPYSGQLANSGEDLRVKDAGPGFPATVDWLRFSSEHPWPRRAGGLGYSLELTRVAPDRDNDLPENWRSSLERGGSPGRIEGITFEPTLFSRGDCSGDGRVNVSDAVALLLHLFRGGPFLDGPFLDGDVRCADACDADGSQDLNLSDAVFLLDWIFGRGTAALPPPGPGACGPASPACAESNCAAA